MGMKFQDSTAVNNVTWTSATPQNATLQAYEWGYCTALITVFSTGTISGGAITFLGWDGYNWFTIPSTQINTSGTIATSYTLTGGTAAFYCNTNAFSNFEVQLSTAITGSGSVFVNINSSAATAAGI